MPRAEPFDVPPIEAVEAFRAKGYRVAFSWLDTSAEQRAAAFTAAKIMNRDVLADIRVGVDRAIAAGDDFVRFEAHLQPLLAARGWWGEIQVVDPVTGEPKTVEIGPRRLRTIFDTNLRVTYARGRWQRIERQAERRP